MTSHLRLRSAAYGNPEPTDRPSRSRPGLVLIDKPRVADSSQFINTGAHDTGRSSVMSDDILKLARIEAKRMRRAKSAIDRSEEATSSAQLQTGARAMNSDGSFMRSGRKQKPADSSSPKKFTNISSKINNKSSSIGNNLRSVLI